MTKPLDVADFRSRRIILEDGDFALIKKSKPLPLNQIDPGSWHHIQDLPDDVSVRTSDWHGSVLKKEVALMAAWIEKYDFKNGPISSARLDAHDAFQASNFARLHGYYAMGVASLRGALELMAIAARYQDDPKNLRYVAWLQGQSHDGISFSSSLAANARIDDLTKSKTKSLYGDLCDYAHSRPGRRDADLWRSNGPIYVREAFLKTHDLFCRTVEACQNLVERVETPIGPAPHARSKRP